MPRDISSSSSEDEADNRTTKSPEKQKQKDQKPTRYQCPADFVSFCHKPCSSTLTESLKNHNNELWLIKAPENFKPECFSGIKVPLSGLKTLKVRTAAGGVQTGGSQQIYSVLASTYRTSDLCLLTSDKDGSANTVFGPTFAGLLNVCENFGGSSASQTPQVIPAIPAPSIPPGLKQRFHPFGSKAPTLTCKAESQVDGASFGPLSTTLCPWGVKRSVEEQEEEEGWKKKKKKEKEVRTEQADAYLQEIKVEPEADTQEEVMMELQESEVMGEKRKKKKKKKDRERDGVEESIEPSVTEKVEDVTIKSEPIDTYYEDVVEVSGKKKKKKKKNKSEDD